MNTHHTKIINISFILLSLVIFVFFTRDIYANMILSSDIHAQLTETKTKLETESDSLSKKSKELKALEGSSDDEISRYKKGLEEEEIITEIYSFADRYDSNGEIKILSISLTQGQENEIGFFESRIDINARVKNTASMMDFLNFLIKNEKYKFFIPSFSLPSDTQGEFNIRVPLKIFYKG